MKTFALKNIMTLSLALLMVVFSSCNKEEQPTPEQRDISTEALGTYDYEMKFYDILSGTPQYLGSEYDESGTVSIKVNPQDDSMLEVTEGGELMVRMANIAATSDGFSFDIPVETHQKEGTVISVEGYNFYDAFGQKHDGLFDKNTKEIKAAIKAEVDGVPVMFTIEGRKK